jgi:cell division protein DivIC
MTVAQGRTRSILTPRGFLLLLIVGGLLFSSVYPLRRYFAVRSSIATLRTEERVLQDRIDQLTAERDLLMSEAEVERLAREQLGMVRPGEVPFVIATPHPEAPRPDVVDPGGLETFAPPDPPSALERWMRAVGRAITA